MRARLVSADGLEKVIEVDRNQRVVRTPVHPVRRFDFMASGPPDPRDAMLQVREYELYAFDDGVAVYREHVVPPPRPVTTARLARALFDLRHEAEAWRLAEERPERLRAVLDTMWSKTKRQSMNECIGEAAALLDRAKGAPPATPSGEPATPQEKP